MQQHTKGVVGILLLVLLEIHRSLQQWKNFANLSTIDKVIAKINRVSAFLDHPVNIFIYLYENGFGAFWPTFMLAFNWSWSEKQRTVRRAWHTLETKCSVHTSRAHGNTGVILDTREHGPSRSAGAIVSDVIIIFYLQNTGGFAWNFQGRLEMGQWTDG